MDGKSQSTVAENRCEIASNSEFRLGRYNLSLFQALMRGKSSMPSRNLEVNPGLDARRIPPPGWRELRLLGKITATRLAIRIK
jgi:hypothetical protein